jgi:zinc protease
MDIGGDRNGLTKGYATEYFARVPQKEIEQAIEYVTDVLWRPLLLPEQLPKEKSAIHVELGKRTRDDKYVLSSLTSKSIHQVTDYGYRSHIPDRLNSLDSISIQDLQKLHQSAYSPEKCILAFGGNFEEAKVLELVQAAIRKKGWAAKGDTLVRQNNPLTYQHIYAERDVKAEGLDISLQAPALDDPDYYAILAMRYILGGKPTARIPYLLRQKHELSYGARAYYTGSGKFGHFGIRCDVSLGNVKKAEKIIQEELLSFRQTGPSDEEVANSIRAITGHISIVQRTDHKVRELVYQFAHTGTLRTPQDRIEGISTVTKKDVLRVAQKIIPKEFNKKNYASARIVNKSA